MRLALVRLSALGDIVHTWPLAALMRAELPHAHITWIVEESLLPLVRRHPAVDSTITVATRRWRRAPFASATRFETGEVRTLLRELSLDVALDTQGTLKSAWVTRWTAASDRVGLARPWRRELLAGFAYDRTTPGSLEHRHVVATNLASARALGVEPPTDPPYPDGCWLLDALPSSTFDVCPKGAYAVLLPGAGHPSKVLSAVTLGEVARGLVDRGLPPVVAWGPGEEGRAAAVAATSGGAATVAPPTSLDQLSALLGRAAAVVGGDTGPVHLAASFGVPTLGVFLTTDWRRNGPLGPRTAVVSGARLRDRKDPTGSAGAEPGRPPTAPEIESRLETLMSA